MLSMRSVYKVTVPALLLPTALSVMMFGVETGLAVSATLLVDVVLVAGSILVMDRVDGADGA